MSHQDDSRADENPGETSQRLTLRNLAGSVISGALGVQTTERRERDFQNGKGHHFFIGGVIYFVLLVSGLIVLVNYIVEQAQ